MLSIWVSEGISKKLDSTTSGALLYGKPQDEVVRRQNKGF
jgi:hypothetical protein